MGNKSRSDISMWTIFDVYKYPMLSAGVYNCLISVLRGGRRYILTLVVNQLGLPAKDLGIINSISFSFDFFFFPVSGLVMDFLGRRFSALPAIVTMACGFTLVAMSESYRALVLAAIMFGIGNGLSCGLIMTMGGDMAPAMARGTF